MNFTFTFRNCAHGGKQNKKLGPGRRYRLGGRHEFPVIMWNCAIINDLRGKHDCITEHYCTLPFLGAPYSYIINVYMGEEGEEG